MPRRGGVKKEKPAYFSIRASIYFVVKIGFLVLLLRTHLLPPKGQKKMGAGRRGGTTKGGGGVT